MGIRAGAVTIGLTFFFVVLTFLVYLTCSVWVELKKFLWSWPSPYAHAMREGDVPQWRRLPD